MKLNSHNREMKARGAARADRIKAMRRRMSVRGIANRLRISTQRVYMLLAR